MEKEGLPTIEKIGKIGDLPEIEGVSEEFEQNEDFEESEKESFEDYPYPDDEEETEEGEEEKIGGFEFFDHPKILFEGKVDNRSRGSVMARTILCLGLMFLPIQFIFIGIAFGLTIDPMFSLLFAGIGTVIPAIFLVFFSLLKLVPFHIEFCDCMIHTIHSEESEKVDKAYRLDYVHSVIDYGSYYYLKHFPVPSKIVCQKNLLIEGTLEEFEAIFEQAGIPIIRKYSTEEK